jgi:ATP-dependent Clp protease ATP-binding subunit ClpC
LKLSEKLGEFIIGQNDAIESLSKAIRRARTGLKNPNRPIGVFMFLGPTGVGKTELAKVLAKYLFTHHQALVKVDMSEFSEQFSLSRLIGAPPGYVGYDEGGELTERVRRNPYSVVLLDEIEKAHHGLYNILLQVFDEGVLTDGLGRKVDFCNSIIIMTSNLGTKEIRSNGLGFGGKSLGDSFQKMKSSILDKVQDTFSPELLNRIDESIVFHSLTEDHVYKIIDLQLNDLVKNLAKIGLGLKLTLSAKQLLVKNGFDPKFGVRPLRREIQTSLEDPIAEMLLKYNYPEGTVIKVDSFRSGFKFTDNSEKMKTKNRSNKN